MLLSVHRPDVDIADAGCKTFDAYRSCRRAQLAKSLNALRLQSSNELDVDFMQWFLSCLVLCTSECRNFRSSPSQPGRGWGTPIVSNVMAVDQDLDHVTLLSGLQSVLLGIFSIGSVGVLISQLHFNLCVPRSALLDLSLNFQVNQSPDNVPLPIGLQNITFDSIIEASTA